MIKNQIHVTIISKPSSDPWFNQGSKLHYKFFPEWVTLSRDQLYAFHVHTVGHPFYLSTKPRGGPSELKYSLSHPTERGLVLFRPDSKTPSTIYGVCAKHEYMTVALSIQSEQKMTRSAGLVLSFSQLQQLWIKRGGVSNLKLEFSPGVTKKTVQIPNEFLAQFQTWSKALEDDPNKEVLDLSSIPTQRQLQIA
jgi:hypothetical protein